MKTKKRSGEIFIVVAIIGMAVILIIVILWAASLMGDRTGSGAGSKTPDGSSASTEETADAGVGNGVCNGSNVKASPIRDTSADAVPVSVPIWKYVSQTQKKSTTMTLRVNRNCTTAMKSIFQQIYNSTDKPPIQTSDTACYSARDNNTSMHNWGGACDINWIENYCIWRSGGLCGPKGWWTPETDVRSIPVSSTITSAFASQGWSRGLWSKKLDYMHYSVNGQ